MAPIAVALSGLALLGCNEGRLEPVDASGDDDDATTTIQEREPQVVLAVRSAFDPLFAALPIRIEGAPDARVQLEIVDDADAVVSELEAELDADGAVLLSWDGRVGDDPAPIGRYRLRASAEGAEDEAEVALLRAGFAAAWLEGDGGSSATRELLYWPGTASLQDEGEPISRLTAVDDGARPLDFPSVGSALVSPPDDAQPAAFVHGSRPILTLEVADRSPAAPDGTGLDLAEIELSVEGWTVLDGLPLSPGAAVVLQRDEPLDDTVGVSELDLSLSFLADGEVLGEQHLPLRIYRLLDVSQFTRPDERYRPWTVVVDQALVAIDGTTAETEAVVDALVAFVFEDLGLRYDTGSGASAYSQYDGWSLERPHFLLSDFLARRYGDTINCSDAGNILGAYANMVGARLDHLILSPGFDLNYIRAIGTTEFTSCPFGPFGCGFSYHAVTTVPGSLHIWDATLALDGDADPGALPSVDRMVQTVSGEEYLDRLVRSGNPRYQNQAQETLE